MSRIRRYSKKITISSSRTALCLTGTTAARNTRASPPSSANTAVVGEQDENAWGYGNAPRTENEFIERYRGLTEALLGNELMFGFCYTQLYDIEQEQNGLYTYDREPKFDMTVFHGINSAKAAIEE